MESWLQVFKRANPFLGVIFLQFGYAGSSIIAKAALNQGMSHYTFAVYRNAIAAAIFAPFAVLFERKVRPRMTTSIFLKITLLGLLEPVMDQNLYFMGMKYTTATFAIAMCNILPAITFVMAWMFRLEKVNIKRMHSQAKILGILVTVGGAMIMTLGKGPTIGLPWTNDKTDAQSSTTSATGNSQDHIKGSLMIIAGCFCWASFIILQEYHATIFQHLIFFYSTKFGQLMYNIVSAYTMTITLKSYPADLSLTTLICAMGAVEGTILTLLVKKGNTAIWSIQWDTKFLAAVYCGIICSGVAYYVSGVIMREKGPVFVTAFNPLSMVIVAVMGSFILAEQMDLGRVLGAIIIVVGIYLVIWGKSKDQSLSSSNKDQVALILVDQEMASRNDGTKTSGPDLVNVSGKTPNDEVV